MGVRELEGVGLGLRLLPDHLLPVVALLGLGLCVGQVLGRCLLGLGSVVVVIGKACDVGALGLVLLQRLEFSDLGLGRAHDLGRAGLTIELLDPVLVGLDLVGGAQPCLELLDLLVDVDVA